MRDTVQQTTALASLAGGFMWGLARIVTVVFAPIPPKKRDVARAFAEAVCSAVAGAIGGVYVAPALCRYLHVSDIETVSAIAVFFGLAFWQLVPLLIAVVTRLTALKLGMATPDNPKGVGE